MVSRQDLYLKLMDSYLIFVVSTIDFLSFSIFEVAEVTNLVPSQGT